MKTGLFRLRNLASAVREGNFSPAGLEELRNEKLRRLLGHAYENVPFHRRRFRALGLGPEDLRDPAALSLLPVMTKEDLRDSPRAETTAGNVDRTAVVEVATNGSTGQPLRIFYTREDFSRLNMNWLRPLSAHGVKPWYRKLEITGPHNLVGGEKWYQRLGLWRRKAISIFQPPEDWVEAWRAYRPEILYGYSGSLKLLARFALEQGIDDIRPRFVFGVSDQADSEGRQLAARAFGRPLTDLYGAAEGGCIAWECPTGEGYHINADTVIVEFLRDGRPVTGGESASIVITNLHSFAMPVIRYALNDIGVPSAAPPKCGRSLPLLQSIEGRTDSQIQLPSGVALSPLFFDSIMKPVTGVRDWRVIQDRTGRITIYAAPTGDFPLNGLERIRRRVEENIREPVELKIEMVETVSREPSGKIRAVVSQLTARRDQASPAGPGGPAD